MDFTISPPQLIAPPFTLCPGPHPFLRSGVRSQNLNFTHYTQVIPEGGRDPRKWRQWHSSSSLCPACRVLLALARAHFRLPAAQSRRGCRHCSILPDSVSSSLRYFEEKQQSPKFYFRSGRWGGGVGGIQGDAVLPSQSHKSQAIGKA